MRADAKMTPLMHPKVEQATKSGISHAITPIVREAKVCKAQWIVTGTLLGDNMPHTRT